ncbi:cytochrome P450, partial [Mycena vulgaris]
MSPAFLSSLDSRWILVLVAILPLCVRYARKAGGPSLPPGPRGFPLVGNIFDVPTGDIWLKFAQLGEVWGDISSITLFGQTMIIVNSLKIAEDLLDVRGANFSDRPIIPMGGELVGFKNVLAFSQYGDRHRKERKLFAQLFGSHAVLKQFVPLLTSERQKMLQKMLVNPNGVLHEIARTTGAITLQIAYGYHILETDDPYIKMFETAQDNFAISTAPAAFMVDIIPALRFWPEWLPGGGFKTTARLWGKLLHAAVDDAYDYVKAHIAAGTAEKSFVSTLLEEQLYDDYLIKWAASSIQAGGSDTTGAQLEAFFLAMCLYPEVQIAAQKEIDAVIGSDRLPNLSDRPQLPYVDALCKEAFRWHVAAPTGKGDGSKPMLIPKDALVTSNIWKMTHDPARYANPMVFDPTRFLATETKKAEADPLGICFGFGRRICPGRMLADTAVFIDCCAILAVFRITKARENGVVVEPELILGRGTVSHVRPFKCFVEPRNARAAELI